MPVTPSSAALSKQDTFDKGDQIINSPKSAADDSGAPVEKLPSLLNVSIFYAATFSFLMMFFYMLGKDVEYHIPVRLNGFSPLVYAIIFLFFVFSLLSLHLFYRTFGREPPSSPAARVRRMSFFLMYFATFFTAAYLCTVCIHAIRGGNFCTESVFVVIFFVLLTFLYVKREKSVFECALFSISCGLLLITIAFYSGIAAAKMEDKMLTSYNMETVVLLKNKPSETILIGYDPSRNVYTGRMIFVSPEVAARLTFLQYSMLNKATKR